MRTFILAAFSLFLIANSDAMISSETNVLSAIPEGRSIVIRPSPDGESDKVHLLRRGIGPSCGDQLIRVQNQNTSERLELNREPASPDKPYAIYAVDRRDAGCSLMVMMGKRDDIRPLPAPMEEPLRIIPADSGQ